MDLELIGTNAKLNSGYELISYQLYSPHIFLLINCQ